MIRNIVFDMGNVLIRFDPDLFMDREGITDAGERRMIRNDLFLSVEWAQMDSGILTEKTAEPMILKHFPENMHAVVSHLLYSWAIPRAEINGMEELVRGLKQAGYSIYLLSNASVSQHRYWPLVPVSRYFDGEMISCDVKVVKPMWEIYHLFTERFELDPEECLFIDDAPNNVAAAIACGWQGIVFHGDAAELRTRLRDMNISC